MNDKIKNILQDCNINFLIGSGLSAPFLPTLGNTENLLTELEGTAIGVPQKELIRASIYKKYFDAVIAKNLMVLSKDADCAAVLQNYSDFLRVMNSILQKRKGTILSKEVNLFTTNVDIFVERALEELGLEYNDGFNGRFFPTFSLSNFKKTRAKRSLHYDNVAELPVFNLMKLHGSLSWMVDGKEIRFSHDLGHVREIGALQVNDEHRLEVDAASTLKTLQEAAVGNAIDETLKAFLEAYEKLLIVVNPTKQKFRDTLLNQNYYELLRLYSNELEKENTVLFVMGFSFADEHICEITIRAANSNPTLMIFVFAYDSEARVQIAGRLDAAKVKNNNVQVIGPLRENKDGVDTDQFKHDLATINQRVFASILGEISGSDAKAGS